MANRTFFLAAAFTFMFAPQAERQLGETRMYVVSASWCGPCQQWKKTEKPALEKVGWKFGRHIEIIDDGSQKAKDIGPYRSIPCFIMVKDGMVYSRHEGYLSASQVSDKYNEAVNARGRIWIWP